MPQRFRGCPSLMQHNSPILPCDSDLKAFARAVQNCDHKNPIYWSGEWLRQQHRTKEATVPASYRWYSVTELNWHQTEW
jgi:hypothetical protein